MDSEPSKQIREEWKKIVSLSVSEYNEPDEVTVISPTWCTVKIIWMVKKSECACAYLLTLQTTVWELRREKKKKKINKWWNKWIFFYLFAAIFRGGSQCASFGAVVLRVFRVRMCNADLYGLHAPWSTFICRHGHGHGHTVYETPSTVDDRFV